MRFDTIFEIVFLIFLVGLAIYIRLEPKSEPPAGTTASKPAPSFASFCGQANLATTALADCRALMAAAKTDDERMKVERTFSMGAKKRED